MNTPADSLRQLLNQEQMFIMPCCHDALSARLIERAGFPLTFMSGFTVSATRLTLLQAIITATERALADLAAGKHPSGLKGFEYVREIIGFLEYYDEEQRYS